MDAAELIALGRAYLRKRAPYLATTIYGLVPVPVKGCGTMAVTAGFVMYYDPDWVENEPEFKTVDDQGKFNGFECVGACIHHECQHVVRGLDRLEALKDPELANIAADMAINYDLREADWRLPPWVVYPETFGYPGGKPLEWYYNEMARDKAAIMQALQQMLEKSGILERTGQSKSPGQQPGQGQQQGQGSGKAQTAPLAGQCGGIAGNPGDKDLESKLDEEVGRPKSDQERIKRVTAHQIKEHIEAHGRGSAPGFTAEDVEYKPKKSVIDWKKQLSRVVRRTVGAVIAGATDFSLRRPSKRSMVLGVVRPGLIDQLCEVAFIRDTSASMGKKDLQAANDEAIAVMKQLGLDEVWFIDADTQVHTCKRMRLKDIPKAKAMGRGGTDFREPLKKASKLRPKPDVVIYLTDGDGTAPRQKPSNFEVVWCVVPSSYARRPAKWGHLVLCSKNQKVRDSFK